MAILDFHQVTKSPSLSGDIPPTLLQSTWSSSSPQEESPCKKTWKVLIWSQLFLILQATNISWNFGFKCRSDGISYSFGSSFYSITSKDYKCGSLPVPIPLVSNQLPSQGSRRGAGGQYHRVLWIRTPLRTEQMIFQRNIFSLKPGGKAPWQTHTPYQAWKQEPPS